jgi:hypothetical protein
MHSSSNGNPESVPRAATGVGSVPNTSIGTSTNEATSTLASGPKE